MGDGLVQVEVPDFGSSVLGSLNQQRILGQYCDVSILVQGQAFQAHRAVLAASSLYFRDLFSSSSSSQPVYELPSSVTPSCFRHILSFCYTGRLSVTAGDQLVLMYTAGYLQIQNIVERGLDLLLKNTGNGSSPLCCDSQTASTEESPVQQHSAPQLQEAEPSSEELLLTISGIKQERADTPPTEEPAGGAGEEVRLDMNAEHQVSRTSALCYLGAGAGLIPAFQSYLLTNGGRSSPAASSLPADSPPSHQTTEEELDEDYYGTATQPSAYQNIYGHAYIQDKVDVLSLPLANERRPCVLVGRDNMALPASLISQIGYRCHPSLYTEGDPGEKVELVAGSGVFMTRGQLMNCHLCAGVKHKVLLRRLLATFFDRNTLANSCGTGIRSSTNDPSRKPLDNRVLNTVKLYCQNFAPGFKESEMNVIAADMCTNARRVRKRWLPKIQSLLPEGLPAPPSSHQRKSKRGGGGGQGGDTQSSSPLEVDLRQLSTSYLGLDVPPCGDGRDRKSTGTGGDDPSPRLQPGGAQGGGGGEEEEDEEGRLHTDRVPDLLLPVSSSSDSSPQPADPAPSHGPLAEDEKRVEPLDDGQ